MRRGARKVFVKYQIYLIIMRVVQDSQTRERERERTREFMISKQDIS